MRLTLVAAVALLGLSTWSAAGPVFAQGEAVDRAFERFWSAKSPQEANGRISEVVESGVSFDQAWRRLELGRSFATASPGVVQREQLASDGQRHHYAVVVSDAYDPATPIAVRVMLHGGVGTTDRRAGARGPIDKLTAAPHITVLPSAWRDAKWWHGTQVENLAAIVDRLKREYNVDENRVHLAGISDGAVGVYFVAMRDTTPWSSYLALIGHPKVLAGIGDVDGQLHLSNLLGKALFAVNTGQDRLYPYARVAPYLEWLRLVGVEVVHHEQPDFGHDTNWWPNEQENIERFLADHPRDPLPDRLSWATEITARYNRAYWLEILELGVAPGEARLEDLNGSAESPFYPRRQVFGRVDLSRSGNRIEVSTEGVRRYRLLLSSDRFDFAAPLVVVTNGEVSFQGRVDKDLGTLLEYAARDNDRTMLFAGQLEIDVGPPD